MESIPIIEFVNQIIRVMNKFFTAVLTLLIFASFNLNEAQAQAPEADKSILDISYHPPRAAFRHFEQMKGQEGVGEPVARVVYSRPAKNGRTIFGDLVKMDEVWRLGANESTELSVHAPMTLGDAELKPGRYTLYAIPSADKWTLIVSNQLDGWGAYAYDAEQDVARVETSMVMNMDDSTELLSIYFSNDGHLNIQWDTTHVMVPVK